MQKLASCSFNTYLLAIRQDLVPNIVTASAYDKIEKAFQALPEGNTNALGIEFNSMDSSSQCDISLSIDPSVCKTELDAWDCKNDFESQLYINVELVSRLVQYFKIDTSSFRSAVQELILELDLASANERVVPLNVFYTLAHNGNNQNYIELLTQENNSITEHFFNEALAASLKHLQNALVDEVVTHIGFMLERKVRALRILVRIKPAQLNVFLQRLGVASEYPLLNPFISTVTPMCEYIVVALDMIDGNIMPSFAVECGYIGSIFDSSSRWWGQFLERIAALPPYTNVVPHIAKIVKTKDFIKQANTNSLENGNIVWGLNHLKCSFDNTENSKLKWYMYMHCVSPC